MNGLLVIDKPGGMTSRDAVNRVQRWFPRKTKIGHTGTLDPLATGVLVVCVGLATRLAGYVQAMSKSYSSRFRLGATSDTDDADGAVVEVATATPPAREEIDTALGRFVGSIEQLPPAVSALKVDGRRAHDLVRKGQEVALAPRPVRIDAVRVRRYEWPWLDVEVDCGKGTYIRSIARDLGAALGCGGMVQALRRTRVGPFLAEQGTGVDAPDPAGVTLLPMTTAVAGMEQL
ncbi:MAG TPA: tRNA pseudouridine(55) synthase TruB, partial [Gemmata sp.]